jgi:hypothetical protein
MNENQERLLALVLYFQDNDNHLSEIDDFDYCLDNRILQNILDMPLAEMNLNARCYDRQKYDDFFDEEDVVEGHQSQPMETILEVILFTVPPFASKLIKTMIVAGADVNDSLDEYRLYGLLEEMRPGACDIFGFENMDLIYMLYYIVEARAKPFSEALFIQILKLYNYMLRDIHFFGGQQEEHYLFYSMTQKLLSIGQQMPTQIYAHPNSDFLRLYTENCDYWGKVTNVMCLKKRGLNVHLL